MNAKELAALAALGMGGAYLYNRNKDSDSGKPAGMPEYQGRTADRLADIQNEYGKEPEMPAYQGRTADRLADIQNEYGKAPAAPAQDLEGRRTSMAIAPAAKKPAARPAAPAAQVAAPETPAGNPKLNSILDTNIYKDSQRRKAALASEEAKANLYQGEAAKSNSRSNIANFMKQRAAKKMASGGKVSSASSRGDGIAQRGKTRGKMY